MTGNIPRWWTGEKTGGRQVAKKAGGMVLNDFCRIAASVRFYRLCEERVNEDDCLCGRFSDIPVRMRCVCDNCVTSQKTGDSVQIRLASVMVDNQENALRFYTTVLGFVKNKDIPMGPFRWLTVSSPEGAEGVELVLEPMGFAPAQTYQKALFAAGVPATAFITNNIGSEYQRLKTLGVSFRGEPKSMGPITAVLFEDTCGNLINLVQPAP
ncbi:MAG TPA: VOC family protein [Candidatus Acidoferrales bacterium]|nr:VOC family protein [Candidatus Acidoferrales bacterium]